VSGGAITWKLQESGSDPDYLSLRPADLRPADPDYFSLRSADPPLPFAPGSKQPVDFRLLKRWHRIVSHAATRMLLAVSGLAVKRSDSRTAPDRARQKRLADMVEVASFLFRLYRLSSAGQINDAIDDIIERFERWMEAGDWRACKEALRNADVPRLHPAVSLAILSMTLVEKSRLGLARQGFFARIRQELVERYDEKTAADNLRGLE